MQEFPESNFFFDLITYDIYPKNSVINISYSDPDDIQKLVDLFAGMYDGNNIIRTSNYIIYLTLEKSISDHDKFSYSEGVITKFLADIDNLLLPMIFIENVGDILDSDRRKFKEQCTKFINMKINFVDHNLIDTTVPASLKDILVNNKIFLSFAPAIINLYHKGRENEIIYIYYLFWNNELSNMEELLLVKIISEKLYKAQEYEKIIKPNLIILATLDDTLLRFINQFVAPNFAIKISFFLLLFSSFSKTYIQSLRDIDLHFLALTILSIFTNFQGKVKKEYFDALLAAVDLEYVVELYIKQPIKDNINLFLKNIWVPHFSRTPEIISLALKL